MRHEESQLQQQCVTWFRAQYPQYAMLLVHPINEGSGHTTVDRRRQGIHKAEGTVAGVPDLLLFMPSAHDGYTFSCLALEMKTEKGKQTQAQKDFERYFTAAGSIYLVIRNIDDFRRAVNNWLHNTPYDLKVAISNTHKLVMEEREAREREHFYKVLGKK